MPPTMREVAPSWPPAPPAPPLMSLFPQAGQASSSACCPSSSSLTWASTGYTVLSTTNCSIRYETGWQALGESPRPSAGAMAEPVLPGKACSRDNGRLRLAERGLASPWFTMQWELRACQGTCPSPALWAAMAVSSWAVGPSPARGPPKRRGPTWYPCLPLPQGLM